MAKKQVKDSIELIRERERQKRLTMRLKKQLEAAPVEPKAAIPVSVGKPSPGTPAVRLFNTTLREVNRLISDPKAPFPSEAQLNIMLKPAEDLAPQAGPGASKQVQLLKTKYSQRVARASMEGQQALISQVGAPSSAALGYIDDMAKTTGKMSPQVVKKALDIHMISPAVTAAEEAARSAGTYGFISNVLAKRPAAASKQASDTASILLRQGDVVAAEKAASEAVRMASMAGRRAGLARAGAGGAGIAALLYALTKGSRQTEMSPAQQLQMMQSMNSQQQAARLSESLAGSRDAAAEQSRARAELMRAQLMQLLSGGAQRNFI